MKPPPAVAADTRRSFFKRAVISPSLVCSLIGSADELLVAQIRPSPRYDLLIKGGQVVDPSQGLSARRDIGISDGQISRIAEAIPEEEARQVSTPAESSSPPGVGGLSDHRDVEKCVDAPLGRIDHILPQTGERTGAPEDPASTTVVTLLATQFGSAGMARGATPS